MAYESKDLAQESNNHKGKNPLEKYIFYKFENDTNCYHKNEVEEIEDENEEGIVDIEVELIIVLEDIDDLRQINNEQSK